MISYLILTAFFLFFFLFRKNFFFFRGHLLTILDCEALAAHVRTLLKSIGRPEDSISEEKIKFFCKQSADLQVTRFTPVSNEFDSSKIQKENIEFWDEKGKWYLSSPFSFIYF